MKKNKIVTDSTRSTTTRDEFNKRRNAATSEKDEEEETSSAGGLAGYMSLIIQIRAARHLQTLTHITDKWPKPPHILTWPKPLSSSSSPSSMTLMIAPSLPPTSYSNNNKTE